MYVFLVVFDIFIYIHEEIVCLDEKGFVVRRFSGSSWVVVLFWLMSR